MKLSDLRSSTVGGRRPSIPHRLNELAEFISASDRQLGVIVVSCGDIHIELSCVADDASSKDAVNALIGMAKNAMRSIVKD